MVWAQVDTRKQKTGNTNVTKGEFINYNVKEKITTLVGKGSTKSNNKKRHTGGGKTANKDNNTKRHTVGINETQNHSGREETMRSVDGAGVNVSRSSEKEKTRARVRKTLEKEQNTAPENLTSGISGALPHKDGIIWHRSRVRVKSLWNA